MSKALMSTDEVLLKIGASDFRSISKDQLVSFVSSIPDMDKETAIKCIEQFPEFRKSATEILGQLYDFCDHILDDHKTTKAEAVSAYRLILDDLSELLKQEEFSTEEKDQITDKMVYVADKIAELSKENDSFLANLARMAGGAATIALAIAGAILGVKLIDKR